jgi:biotin operon repressor
MTRRRTRLATTTPDDLWIVARLEGKPLLRGQALADALGLSPAAARAHVRRLKRLGVLAFVSSAQLRPETCECITYLQVGGTGPGDLESLDRRIAADPFILLASRLAGDFDCRLYSRHADYRTADAWSRSFEADPRISRISTRFSKTLFERPNYAAAILGTE